MKYILNNLVKIFNFLLNKTEFYLFIESEFYNKNYYQIFDKQFEKKLIYYLNKLNINEILMNLNYFKPNNIVQKKLILNIYLLIIINKSKLEENIISEIWIKVNSINLKNNNSGIKLETNLINYIYKSAICLKNYLSQILMDYNIRNITTTEKMDLKKYFNFIELPNDNWKELYFEYFLLNIIKKNISYIKVLQLNFHEFNSSNYTVKIIINETFYIYKLLNKSIDFKIKYYFNDDNLKDYDGLIVFLFSNYSMFVRISTELDEICNNLAEFQFYFCNNIEMVNLFNFNKDSNKKIEIQVLPFLKKYKSNYIDIQDNIMNREINNFYNSNIINFF